MAEKDGKRIAIEIETGKSDFAYNIRKTLGNEFTEIVFVSLTDNANLKIREYLSFLTKEEREKISVKERSYFI